jgi:hypothetical protein
MFLHDPASKTNHKRVSSHLGTPFGVGTSHGHLDSLVSPWPGLGGSHHLPPYSILCNFLRELHSNDTFSRDSQGGVPKLSRVGVPRLWELISPGSNLWLEWGLNQSCSSHRELFNAMSHSSCKRQEKVDSRLLVVGSQTASFTPSPSFAYNLGCICPMAHARPFWTSTLQDLSNDIKNIPMRGVLAPAIELWVFGSPRGLQLPTFESVSFIFTFIPKWGCDSPYCMSKKNEVLFEDHVWKITYNFSFFFPWRNPCPKCLSTPSSKNVEVSVPTSKVHNIYNNIVELCTHVYGTWDPPTRCDHNQLSQQQWRIQGL